MQLIDRSTQFNDSNIANRFEELAELGNGKWHFTDSEVFIASGFTRMLVNALPDICNIIQHFAFESSKALALAGSGEMGGSMFSESSIEAFVQQDVAQMTQAKIRELYYQIRQQLEFKYDKSCQKESALQFVRESFATAASVHINERDALIVEMEECGLFEESARNRLMSAECSLVSSISEYISEYAVSADFENYLDAIRINLGI